MKWNKQSLTVTPPDTVLCKRPVVSNRFYKVVQRDDVDVVTDGIARVVPEGVVTADGTTYELDVLILATGFASHNYMRPMAMTGEDGATLDEAWADGPHGCGRWSVPTARGCQAYTAWLMATGS